MFSLFRFDRFASHDAELEEELIDLVIAACLVESRGEDYGEYLSAVFRSEPTFVTEVKKWATEEAEHGAILGDWLSKSIRNIDIEFMKEKYNAGCQLYYKGKNLENSIRGTNVEELLSRCAVECGTSTFYAAIENASKNTELKIICRQISKDEVRHFSFFKRKIREMRHFKDLNRYRQFMAFIGRFKEAQDRQFCYAYYIARCRRTSEFFYQEARIKNMISLSIGRIYKRTDVARAVKLILYFIFEKRLRQNQMRVLEEVGTQFVFFLLQARRIDAWIRLNVPMFR